MNILVWAEMQSQDVLLTVDMMCPDIIQEKDVEYRYTNHQTVVPEFEQLSPAGKEKIYAGLTLIGYGVAQFADPTKAWQMRQYQKVGTRIGFAVGARFPAAVGAGPGAAFGHSVGTTFGFLMIYGSAFVSLASGVYMTAEGMIEYHHRGTGDSFVRNFI